MKSIRPKYFLASSLIVFMCLVAFQGVEVFSAPLQTQQPPAPPEPPAPEVNEESGGQIPPDLPDIPDLPEMPDFSNISVQRYGGERVRVGASQHIGPDETVGNLVTIFSAAELAGKTEREMVTIFGNSTMTGETGREMVTVFGNSNMSGTVNREMVTVFGDAEVNGRVDRDVVVVFGSLKLGPDAVVNGECVVVFGHIDRNAGAILARGAIEYLPQLSSLKNYILEGPLLGRLLPPGSVLAWIVVALHFILYLLVAGLLPKPTADGVRQLDANPLLCFGVGLLTMILIAPLSIILVATGVGILLLPFLGLAETAFTVLGKASILQFFGLQILRRFQSDADTRPIMAFLVGFLLVTVVYMIPVLGLLVWFILRPLALGTTVLAVFKIVKKNGNGTSTPGIPVSSTPEQAAAANVPPPPPVVSASSDVTSPMYPPESGGTIQADSRPMESSGTIRPETVVMPRAGFWIRLAATVLDFILLVWILPITREYFLLVWLAYHVAMWAWKGTTIGGIICKLKVVRLDGKPVDAGVSLVRSLASFFSVAVLGLGFFWAGWSRDRQSWHDLIAGTIIVRVPSSVRLI